MKRRVGLLLALSMSLGMVNMVSAADTKAPVIKNVEVSVVPAPYDEAYGASIAKYEYELSEAAKGYVLFTKKSNYEKNKLSAQEIVYMLETGSGKYGQFKSDDYYGYYGGGYEKEESRNPNGWFDGGTEYVFMLVAKDHAGNISEEKIVEFVTPDEVVKTEIPYVEVDNGVFKLSAFYIGRNFDTNKVTFNVIDRTFYSGSKISYVAVPRVIGGSVKAPTYNQVVAGLDGNGKEVAIKGSDVTKTGNTQRFEFDADDNTAYDVHIVASHGDVKSSVDTIVVTTDKDVTAPRIGRLYDVTYSGESLKYQYAVSEMGTSYMVIIPKTDADKYATSLANSVDIKNLALGNKKLGESVKYFVDVRDSSTTSTTGVKVPGGLPTSANNEYVMFFVVEDMAGNLSKPEVLELANGSRKGYVSTGVFDIGAYCIGRDFEANKATFSVTNTRFKNGVTFNYIAIPKSSNTKMPTYEQVIAGLDASGKAVSIKGSVLSDTSNSKKFELGLDDDNKEYDVYFVGAKDEAKSEVVKAVVTKDKDVTAPKIVSLSNVSGSNEKLNYNYELTESGTSYVIVVPKSDADKYASSLVTSADIKNLALKNKTLGGSNYFSNVGTAYTKSQTGYPVEGGLPASTNNEYVMFFAVEDYAGNLSTNVMKQEFIGK